MAHDQQRCASLMETHLFSDAEMASLDVSGKPVPHPFGEYIDHQGVILDHAAAAELFHLLLNSSPWARRTLQLHGKEVEMPRDIAWYGATKDKGVYSADARAWPGHLLQVKALVETRTGFVYNGCLCNLYRDGTNSVAWHSDREAYNGAVASLSLGATRVFRVRDKADHVRSHDFLLPSGSLLLMKPGCQEHTEHCVPKTKRVVGPRINLTFRQVT
jgi:alkylated DNA repair dioxygenase AlkB